MLGCINECAAPITAPPLRCMLKGQQTQRRGEKLLLALHFLGHPFYLKTSIVPLCKEEKEFSMVPATVMPDQR